MCLVKKYMPKLHAHLFKEKYLPIVYGIKWFLTNFAVTLPFEVALRIWDIYMVEGSKIIFRVALAIFKLNQAEILKREFEGIGDVLNTFYKTIDADTLIKTALSFKFSKKLIEKLGQEYHDKPDPEIMENCQKV